jgi:hypothetical protein
VAARAWNGGGGDVATGFYSLEAAPSMERGGLDAGFGLVEPGRRRKAPASIFGR